MESRYLKCSYGVLVEIKTKWTFLYFCVHLVLSFDLVTKKKTFFLSDVMFNAWNISSSAYVCLVAFVVDCGMVTRPRESCYRPPEYLMKLRDEHNARPHYRWREWGRGEEGV